MFLIGINEEASTLSLKNIAIAQWRQPLILIKHGTFGWFWIARLKFCCNTLLPYVLFAAGDETNATKGNQTKRLKTKYVSF